MKHLTIFLFSLFLSFSCQAQNPSPYRGDTTIISIPYRLFLFTTGIGVEVTSKQHSFGVLLNQNFLPMQWDIRSVTSLAGEYKRYYWSKRPGTENYVGSYLIAMRSAYPGPNDSDWEGNWFRSKSLNAGPFFGYKRYFGKRGYYDLFLGAHIGHQTGSRRWDERDPITNSHSTRLEKDQKLNYGLRLGLNLGIQLN